MPTKKPHPGRRGKAVTLAPLTLEQALGAALRVKPSDMKKLEEADARGKTLKKSTRKKRS
ncbi:MAG TPA: hypothetical protein VL282_13085 [Tepidisphaeraceae bacterium]|jgi:hypothetical protein|nr:hypothetical protein [Tepidisphaeraceae bacterium]